nr:dTDP-4-dehydrorhamnose 3,5-epimerase family protein [Xenorhabdus bovienii]
MTHGFTTLRNTTGFLYKAINYYTSNHEKSII